MQYFNVMNIMLNRVISLTLFLIVAGSVQLVSASEIGRMRVAIWPEHDDSSVLVIYDGRFIDDGVFPREETFYLPKGAKISDACSLSPRGQHFCQLYKQKTVGDVDEVRLKLPYPNFYLSFHVDAFSFDNPSRDFKYVINTNHTIRTLVVDIEEPLRSKDFTIFPAASEIKEDDGIKHHWYNIDKPEKNIFTYKISYKKSDNRPSIDIKYAPMGMNMEDGGMPMSHSPERRSFLGILYFLAASGIVFIAILFWFVLRKKKVE